MNIIDIYMKHLNKEVEHYWNIYHFDMTPNHTSHNNEADAFKHCFMQAELTLWLGRNIAKIIGDMHENKPENPPEEKKMDLHNNEIGREIGLYIKKNCPISILISYKDEIADKIMDAMRSGKLVTKV